MGKEQNAIRNLGIIDPTNCGAENHDFYSSFYKTRDDDSPSLSRHSILTRLYANLTSNTALSLILDLGAGKQILEREYIAKLAKQKQQPNCHFLTVDLADITHNQLLASPTYCTHFKVDGCALPFSDEKFDAAISNMALDFMGPKAINEIHRILAKGCRAFLNFHHPSMIPENLENLIAKVYRKINNKIRSHGTISEFTRFELKSLLHRKYLRDNNILFQTTDQITEVLSSHGFTVTNVLEAAAFDEKWWEADVIKK